MTSPPASGGEGEGETAQARMSRVIHAILGRDVSTCPCGTCRAGRLLRTDLLASLLSGGFPVPPSYGALPQREASPRQVEARRVEEAERTAQPYRPYAVAELNWPSPDQSMSYGSTCAHICGDNHRCDARATRSLTYAIPSGGTRTMPVCAPCYEAEQRAAQAEEG